jgi:hypothetical protein
MGQIGGLLGQNDQKKTSSIFESAAASILGGIMNKASSPQGAEQVFGAVQNTDDSILDKLGDLLGGNDQSQIQQQGSGILDLVFGNQQSGIIGSLSRALGLDDTMIGKLLTMAAPILMGVIGRHVKSKALDMVGFGSMLSDQKQHLGSYLPQGMGSELGLGNLTNSSSPASPATSHAPAEGGGSIAKLLIPLLLLGALAFGAFKMMGNDNGAKEAMEEEVPELNIDGDLDLGSAAGALGLGDGIDFDAIGGDAAEKLKGLNDQFTGIADGFKGLTDEDGANDLKGKLEGLTGSVGDLGLSEMSGLAKTSASTMVGKFVEMVQGFVDKIDNPAIKGIVQPAVDALLTKLDSLNLG